MATHAVVSWRSPPLFVDVCAIATPLSWGGWRQGRICERPEDLPTLPGSLERGVPLEGSGALGVTPTGQGPSRRRWSKRTMNGGEAATGQDFCQCESFHRVGAAVVWLARRSRSSERPAQRDGDFGLPRHSGVDTAGPCTGGPQVRTRTSPLWPHDCLEPPETCAGGQGGPGFPTTALASAATACEAHAARPGAAGDQVDRLRAPPMGHQSFVRGEKGWLARLVVMDAHVELAMGVVRLRRPPKSEA